MARLVAVAAVAAALLVPATASAGGKNAGTQCVKKGYEVCATG